MRVYVFKKENKQLFMTTEKASAMGTPKVESLTPLGQISPLVRSFVPFRPCYGPVVFWGMDCCVVFGVWIYPQLGIQGSKKPLKRQPIQHTRTPEKCVTDK
jgi:hypothetical protein